MILMILLLLSQSFASINTLNAENSNIIDVSSPKSNSVIISIRWMKIEQQFHHLLFGISIAQVLNMPFRVEYLKFPVDSPQPIDFFDLNSYKLNHSYEQRFSRLRVDKELSCKSFDYFTKNSTKDILIRNYIDLATLYANRHFAPKLISLYGYHAAHSIARQFLIKNQTNNRISYDLGIDITIFQTKRSKCLSNTTRILEIFQNNLNILKYNDKHAKNILITTNNAKDMKHIKRIFPKSKVQLQNSENFFDLVNCNVFIGTFRSEFSNAVALSRKEQTFMIDTNSSKIELFDYNKPNIIFDSKEECETCTQTFDQIIRQCTDNSEFIKEVNKNFVYHSE